jgi:hypothetical protein
MPSRTRLTTCAAFAALASVSALGWAETNASLSSVHEVPAPSSGTSAPVREGSARSLSPQREGRLHRSRLLVLNDCPGVSSSLL